MWLAVSLWACGGAGTAAQADPEPVPAPVPAPAPVPEPASAPAPAEDPGPPPTPSVKSTETLTTRDGVALEADLYLGEPGAAGVVLLHMIPPHWDRTSWPSVFVDALAAEGWNLCIPDRRGSGKSGGVAQDAYVGPKGAYDVEACVKRLEAHGLGKLGIVGASNGTTSMLDYAALAEIEGLKKPDVVGFMTGGKYTESQSLVVTVEAIPAVFTYSSDEREWSAGLRDVSPKWVFHEYPGGDHGTKMFEKRPGVTKDLLRSLLKGLH
ncbi:MAG: hypothetical protein R3F61_08205 [Myxococcota bacterium]